MTSTSAPRARSSDSKVDCASPSPEKTISARQASGPSPAGSGASSTRVTPSAPAGGVAATKPPSCWPRAVGAVSAPVQAVAAELPQGSRRPLT
eukprot:2317389-Pleurochrysis_carterae.AAC.1